MRNKSAKELRALINHLSCQLIRLKPGIEECEKTSLMYNRLLIQRANIKKKLKDMHSGNIFSSMMKKLSFEKNPKLICDYFKSS